MHESIAIKDSVRKWGIILGGVNYMNLKSVKILIVIAMAGLVLYWKNNGKRD